MQRQQCGNCAVDQRLCFHYIGSTIPLIPKSVFKSLAISCGCSARFVSDLVGNPEGWLCWNAAHISGSPDIRSTKKLDKSKRQHSKEFFLTFVRKSYHAWFYTIKTFDMIKNL